MIGCLWTRARKQPIVALYFESETVLKFYNLETRFLYFSCLLDAWCHVAVIAVCLFHEALWVGLKCVIVAIHGHAHLLSCFVIVRVLCLFLAVSSVDLWSVIMALFRHKHLFMDNDQYITIVYQI